MIVGITSLATGAGAQLPGLPGGPWQSGIGYFVGPINQGGNSVYCTELSQVLKYGYLWSAFLAPVAPNNATPSGYTYNGVGGQCATQVPGAYMTNGFGAFGNSSGPTPPDYSQYGSFNDIYSDWPAPTQGAYYVLPMAPPLPPPGPEDPPTVEPPTFTPVVTPEPATWILMATGLAVLVGVAAAKGFRV
jgi:hypothetical protein